MFYPSEVNIEAKPIQLRVNKTTELLAPEARLKDVGNIFLRILYFTYSVEEGYFEMLAKIDLSDEI